MSVCLKLAIVDETLCELLILSGATLLSTKYFCVLNVTVSCMCNTFTINMCSLLKCCIFLLLIHLISLNWNSLCDEMILLPYLHISISVFFRVRKRNNFIDVVKLHISKIEETPKEHIYRRPIQFWKEGRKAVVTERGREFTSRKPYGL